MSVSEAFKNEVYESYCKKVLGYINGKVCNLSLAEDLCSEVFLKIFEKLDTFDAEKASLSTWIFTVTRNRLTDYYRTRRVFEEIPETLKDDSGVEAEICNQESLDELADALEKLDSRTRDIIILHYYSGCTLKEIAERLDISYAYIKILHKKALALLREILGEKNSKFL